MDIGQIIARDRGKEDASTFASYVLDDVAPITTTAKELLQSVPPASGACAMLSAGWAAYLRHRFSIPAVAVAGDLKIRDHFVFECTENIPVGTGQGMVISKSWGGHCWMEIDGYICDLSIFRTAYTLTGKSRLKSFVEKTFGKGRGALVCQKQELDRIAMNYRPKHVLSDAQMDGLLAALDHTVSGRTIPGL